MPFAKLTLLNNEPVLVNFSVVAYITAPINDNDLPGSEITFNDNTPTITVKESIKYLQVLDAYKQS